MPDAPRPPSLTDTQALFHALVTAPDPVADALARGVGAPVLQGRPLEDVFLGGRWPALRRLEVYGQMYFARLHDVLAENFPAVRAVTGEVGFHNLCVRYLAAHPPHHPSISRCGDALPGFLEGQQLPALAGLAALESARVRVFDAADAPALTRDALFSLPPDAWPSLRLQWVPAHAVVWVPAPERPEKTPAGSPLPVWRSVTSGEGLSSLPPAWEAERGALSARLLAPPREEMPDTARAPVLVWRRGATTMVSHRHATPTEAPLLDRLAEGVAFADLCEALAAPNTSSDGSLQDVMQTAAALLLQWVDEALLRQFTTT